MHLFISEVVIASDLVSGFCKKRKSFTGAMIHCTLKDKGDNKCIESLIQARGLVHEAAALH